MSGIGPNIGTFGYGVNKGQEVFNNSEGEYNPVISDGKRIYLTGTSTIRAFKPEAAEQGQPAGEQRRKKHGGSKAARPRRPRHRRHENKRRQGG